MENVKAALLRDVEAALDLLKCHKAMKQCGIGDNPFWNNYATIADGIYHLIGEHKETFEESVTFLVLNVPYLTVSRRTEMLYAEYLRNFPEQSKPNTMEPEDVRKMAKKNGGYMAPEGDWK